MKISRSNLAASFTALACAGVIGGVTAVSLVGQEQPSRDTIVRQVSGDGGADASPSAQASASVAATTPAAETTPTTTTTPGSQPVTQPGQTAEQPASTTDPAPAEPTREPVAPPANSGGASGPPVGDPPPRRPGMQCLPQEYGINPRCPLPAPTD